MEGRRVLRPPARRRDGDAVMKTTELLRYNSVMGSDLMHYLVDTLSGIGFADGEFAIPNEIVPGVSRMISAHGYPVKLRASRMDEVSHA